MVMRVSVLAIALSLVSVAAHAQQRLIVGVTDLAVAARELPAQAATVRGIIGISSAIAVTGDPERLRHLPFVRYVEDDPPDAVSIDVEALEYGVNQINAEAIWGGAPNATTLIAGQGGAGIKVAVIDTGIDCGHQDLAGGCVYGANFVNGSQPFDDNGHGTHVGGIIAARQNGVGVIGVAPEATVYAVKVMDSAGSGSWSSVAMGIDWAVRNGMHVINMSLGATTGSQAVADAVARAEAAGVLVVASAGNSGCCNTVGYPAAYDGVLAVAAVDSIEMRAGFSSTGPQVDIAAPGVGIRSSVPTGSCSLCDPSGYLVVERHLDGGAARGRRWCAVAIARMVGYGSRELDDDDCRRPRCAGLRYRIRLRSRGCAGRHRRRAAGAASTGASGRHGRPGCRHYRAGEWFSGSQARERHHPGDRERRRGRQPRGVLRQRLAALHRHGCAILMRLEGAKQRQDQRDRRAGARMRQGTAARLRVTVTIR